MIVCSCNALSDKQIVAAVISEPPPSRISQIYSCLGCRAQCGQCAATVEQIHDGARASR